MHSSHGVQNKLHDPRHTHNVSCMYIYNYIFLYVWSICIRSCDGCLHPFCTIHVCTASKKSTQLHRLLHNYYIHAYSYSLLMYLISYCVCNCYTVHSEFFISIGWHDSPISIQCHGPSAFVAHTILRRPKRHPPALCPAASGWPKTTSIK